MVKNKLTTWYILFSILFLIICTTIFKNYSWMYLDNSWTPNLSSGLYYYSLNFLNSLSESTYFWYDSSLLGFSRILTHFYFFFWEFFLYFIFLSLSFILAYKILNMFFKKGASIFWGILFTFNPVSLLFLNLSWFIFAYPSLLAIIYSISKFIKSKRYLYILLLVFWSFALISYIRILWIYVTFLLLISFFYFKEIKKFIVEDKKIFIWVFITMILIFLPLFFAIVFPYLSLEKDYFRGIWNYAISSKWDSLYYYSKNTPIYEFFQIKEITWNFAWNYKNSTIFVIFFSSFTIWLIIIAWIQKNTKYRFLTIYLITILITIIFIRAWGYFINKDIYLNFIQNYYPFIANNTSWLLVLYIPIVVFLFSNIYNFSNHKKFFFTIWSIFIFFSLFPIIINLIAWNNYKLKLINTNQIPSIYKEEFFDYNWKKEASVFYPNSTPVFNWSSYPISVNNNNNYLTLFSKDDRIVNSKQKELYFIIQNLKNNPQNLSILNNKNIFVFKNIRNPEIWEFDYVAPSDDLWTAWRYLNYLNKNKDLIIEESNTEFTKFIPIYKDDYEYFLYSPSNIIRENIDDFLNKDIDIKSRPIVIDDESFHKPRSIDNFKIPETNQNIRIDYKRSLINPTKYFLKISDVDTSQPFLVQLNQTFGMSWKLKWIDEDEFRRYNCKDDYEYFPITNNSYCLIEWDNHLSSLWDYKYLNKKEVPEKNHFEWNFVWNTWIVTPESLREEDRWKKELYAVIIYEKQLWYIWSIMISLWTLWVLILLTIIQEYSLYKKRKNDKKS